MAGPVPANHDFLAATTVLDARDKRGHDDSIKSNRTLAQPAPQRTERRGDAERAG